MPFKFEIDRLERGEGELVLVGRVIDGAFSGPEVLEVTLEDGRTAQVGILHHSFQHPQGWPVLPTHTSTILALSIPLPPDGVTVDASRPAIGKGTVTQNSQRVELSHLAAQPEFWASFLNESLSSEEEEPHQTFFGVSKASFHGFYEQHLKSHWQRGTWPFFRLALDQGRFLELECAAGVEYQWRYWLGAKDRRRTLLGYSSGHFSLPAFRHEELSRLVVPGDVARSAFLLVCATAAYTPDKQSPSVAYLRPLLETLPGVNAPADVILSALLKHITVPQLNWRQDPERGWVNDGGYSQRNPESSMSILEAHDFRFIRDTFG